MLFSSISFLYFFLPAVLLAYYAVPRRFKNAVLLAASLLFYALGEPVYVLLLVFSSVSDWLHSLYIESHRGTRGAKLALVSSIVINLGMLGFFKYTDFFIGIFNSLTGLDLPVTGIPLPIGISFFTFQTMSYTIDVYRGNVHAQRNLVSFSTFVCLFPQLIAGPIVRYSDIESEINVRETTLVRAASGSARFVCGLAKKVLIANQLGELVASVSADSVLAAWLSALGFTLQIYFDFSGYSDMAIGLGALFGFTFPENFDYPYMSRSVTEFWRRWHMTLGGWFRDYVYFPLGGSRSDRVWKRIRNLAVVWLLTGLWHGASWNFVLWGVMYGVLLALEKYVFAGMLKKTPRILQHILLLLVTVVGFAVFNADGLGGAASAVGGMFGFTSLPLVSESSLYLLRSFGVVMLIASVGATPLPAFLWKKLSASAGGKAGAVLRPVGCAVLLLCATAYLVDGSFNPFLYFRF